MNCCAAKEPRLCPSRMYGLPGCSPLAITLSEIMSSTSWSKPPGPKSQSADSSSPFHEVLQKREDEFLRDHIGQISFPIESLLSVGDHHFGLIDREHV